MKRIAALYLYLSYKLEYHYWLQISLKNWLWMVVAGPLALALLRRIDWLVAASVSALGILLLAGTLWAKRRQYVLLFDRKALPKPGSSNAGQRSSLLQADEQIRCRAFGLFAVGGKERYVAREDALLSFVRTREHIVMAFVRRTRFLLFAASLKNQVGWWYVFVSPDQLLEVQSAALWYGLRTHTALIIRYRSKQREDQAHELYLVFEDVDTRHKVIEDLRLDLPEDALG